MMVVSMLELLLSDDFFKCLQVLEKKEGESVEVEEEKEKEGEKDDDEETIIDEEELYDEEDLEEVRLIHVRGQKFHLSACNYECNLESNSSQSTRPVERVL